MISKSSLKNLIKIFNLYVAVLQKIYTFTFAFAANKIFDNNLTHLWTVNLSKNELAGSI